MKKSHLILAGALASFLGFIGNAAAAADITVTSAGTDLTTYFTDNLPTVIAAFIAVAMAIWVLGLLFKSVGVKKPSKVG